MKIFGRLAGKSASRAKPSRKKDGDSRYRSVQVIPGSQSCCSAVEKLAGQKFLSDAVPRLPLDDCDAADCRCTFELHKDRRSDVRRASDLTYDIASQICTDNNRDSHSAGRRQKD